jgi:uncharacterized protein DUF3168
VSFAPVFATLAASTAVKAQIGSSPVRCYPVGEAPQGVTLPYATYQQIAGGPENYLGELPDIDSGLVQIDVYAKTVVAARSAFLAIRDAVEPVAYVTATREVGRDPDTNNVHLSMDTDWLTSR